ncbi:CcdB family protein [Phaeobacter gallaeciensis]|uniref:Toxin CcdB n=1 Tax=Phaeobacter gallaeciensis TaxID=60890 RepID=A0ABD4XF33_9RHOB|nr:CcdB family protein [Phaeobacter gallaeciensis]MDE4146941.1 CcdB family protein [Phaeobacter gallaeciensis]MDE4159598.1 CcdB family protein [Phaeobacter gallaeciensis]MDE4163790.1 CcdB family protein [Phaeobacter gallaeciensis]MDE4168053.1 CcdB family protein [Phaeobacter gallaeciensis]MDE4172257.1 CcdB family protein [Phaeobacter gallaeciensis]
MAQFHVYRVPGDRLVLDLQTDLIETGTRVVAPLIPTASGPKAIGRLEPVLDIDGTAYVLHTAEMAAIPSAVLKGEPVADLTASDYEIRGALDMVFSGF